MKRIARAKLATGLMVFALIVTFVASGVRVSAKGITVVTVDLGGSGETLIRGFSVAPIVGAQKSKPQFTLQLNRGLMTDTNWISAFQNGASYDTVVVRGYDGIPNLAITYTFTNATVTNVTQKVLTTGTDAEATEQLTLSAASLAITTP